jgi:hypothetical protein
VSSIASPPLSVVCHSIDDGSNYEHSIHPPAEADLDIQVAGNAFVFRDCVSWAAGRTTGRIRVIVTRPDGFTSVFHCVTVDIQVAGNAFVLYDRQLEPREATTDNGGDAMEDMDGMLVVGSVVYTVTYRAITGVRRLASTGRWNRGDTAYEQK